MLPHVQCQREKKDKALNSEITLSDTFLANDGLAGFGKVFPSHEELKIEQSKDATLSPLFEEAVSEEEIIGVSCGYFVNDSVLMRKWTSPRLSSEDDWSSGFKLWFQVCIGLTF